jgi:hypothetical protein
MLSNAWLPSMLTSALLLLLLQVLVCPDKKRPDENKDKASLGYDEQVCRHSQGHL